MNRWILTCLLFWYFQHSVFQLGQLVPEISLKMPEKVRNDKKKSIFNLSKEHMHIAAKNNEFRTEGPRFGEIQRAEA